MLTDPNETREISRLAFHADFILILLAPFYWIWPDPRILLLVQTIVTAAGAYFVYLITKKVLNQKLLGVVLALAYLLSPALQRVNIYDFHAPALATMFLLATVYFYLQKRYVWFLIFALLAAFCKEQIWAIIAVFGIFLMIHQRKWLLGSVVFLFSAGMFYFLVSYAIPQLLGEKHFALEYYSDFGSSPAEVIKTIILSPDKLFAAVMGPEQTKYLKQLFSPLGYLSYLAPWWLIFAGPDLLINLLSNNSQLRQIYYQYSAAITPFVFVAAIYGILYISKLITYLLGQLTFSGAIHGSKEESGIRNQELGSKTQKIKSMIPYSLFLIPYILYHSINAAYLYGPLPGSKEPNIAMMTKPEKNRELIDRTIAAIPSEKKVAASNNIGAHLSNRRHIYVLPQGADKADILIFFLTGSESSHQVSSQRAQILQYSLDPSYKIVVQKDEFVVFEKLTPNP